jgi:hypothetical protein
MNTQNNKLIAEFLGEKTYLKDTDGYSKPLSVFNSNDLIFDKDWNWLMQVVEKIEGLEVDFKVKSFWNPFVKANVHQTTIQVNEHTKMYTAYSVEEVVTIYTNSSKNKLENVYEGVINFIKWNNEIKNYENINK